VVVASLKPIAASMRDSCKTPSCQLQDEKRDDQKAAAATGLRHRDVRVEKRTRRSTCLRIRVQISEFAARSHVPPVTWLYDHSITIG
jgi:hypothetical protein